MDATRGLTLTYNDRPVTAVYSKNLRIYREQPGSLNFDHFYLRAVPDRTPPEIDACMPPKSSPVAQGTALDPQLQPGLFGPGRLSLAIMGPPPGTGRTPGPRRRKRNRRNHLPYYCRAWSQRPGERGPDPGDRRRTPHHWRCNPFPPGRIAQQPLVVEPKLGPDGLPNFSSSPAAVGTRGRYVPKRRCGYGRRRIFMPGDPLTITLPRDRSYQKILKDAFSPPNPEANWPESR